MSSEDSQFDEQQRLAEAQLEEYGSESMLIQLEEHGGPESLVRVITAESMNTLVTQKALHTHPANPSSDWSCEDPNCPARKHHITTVHADVKDPYNTLIHSTGVLRDALTSTITGEDGEQVPVYDRGYRRDCTMRWTRKMVRAINILREELDLAPYVCDDD